MRARWGFDITLAEGLESRQASALRRRRSHNAGSGRNRIALGGTRSVASGIARQTATTKRGPPNPESCASGIGQTDGWTRWYRIWREALRSRPLRRGRNPVTVGGTRSVASVSTAKTATTERGPPGSAPARQCLLEGRAAVASVSTAKTATTERGPPDHLKTRATSLENMRDIRDNMGDIAGKHPRRTRTS